MNPSIKRDNRDATSCNFHSTANHSCNWPEEKTSDSPVDTESVLVLTLQLSRILPWDAFWVGSVLSESVGHPRVTLEVFLQEV